MSESTVDSLRIKINSDAKQANDGVDSLTASLTKLKTATQGLGLTRTASGISKISKATNSLNSESISNLNKLSAALRGLGSVGSLKISSSVANQIVKLGNATSSLQGKDFSTLGQIGAALEPLSKLEKMSGLRSAITQLQKLPQLATELKTLDMNYLTTQFRELSTSLAPLASELNKIGSAFSNLPTKIRSLTNVTKTATRANNSYSKSHINLLAKLRMIMFGLRGAALAIANVINVSNEYVEDLNLFNVAMGDGSQAAFDYAEQMSNLMGIDPAEWLRNQGIFKTIISSFGVGAEKASLMSENLTRLGYDISSLYDIPFEESMQKLTSGISGELEPLRRLGYDLSQTRLQMEAESLGIQKKFTEMTQLEKVQLRYNAILKQSSYAQQDMARTLESPANQLRIFRAQITLAARSLGNIFIPVLSRILPVAIAVTKVITLLANVIARLFGYKAQVFNTELSTSVGAMGGIADGANDTAGGLGNAAKKAKELKNHLLGIDELNVIAPEDPSSGSGGSGGAGGIGGAGGDFDVLSYEWMEIAKSKADEIAEKIKSWLGLTEEITSWADLFHTRLGHILTVVGSIGLGFLAWKLSSKFTGVVSKLMEDIKNLKAMNPLFIGIGLTVTGVVLEASALMDAIIKGLDLENFAMSVLGSAGVTGGAALIGTGIAKLIGQSIGGGAIWGAAIGAIVSGIPMFLAGIKTSIERGITWLSATLTELGATLAGAGIGAIVGTLVGPIGTAAGALIGAAGGAIFAGLNNIFILIKQKGIEGLAEAIGNIAGWLYKGLTVLAQPFVSLWNSFTSWANEKQEALYAMANSFGESIVKFFSFENLKKFFSRSEMKKLGKNMMDGIIEGFKKIKDKIVEIKDAFIKGFKEAFGIHSPSTVMRDEIGIFAGEGLLAGLAEPFKNCQTWLVDHIINPIKKVIEKNPVAKAVVAIKNTASEWWSKAKTWWEEKSSEKLSVESLISLVKKGWNTVGDWVKSFGNLKNNSFISLLKSGWNTVGDWVKSFGNLQNDSKVSLIKNAWSTVGSWVKSFGNTGVNSAISLLKNAWTTVSEWVIGRGSTAVSSWVGLVQNWKGTVSDWVNKKKGSTKITIGIGLVVDKVTGAVKTVVNAIKGIFASTGGVFDSVGNFVRFANGGAISQAGAKFFSHIPQYAGGTSNAHGSMFIAGEAGPEIVGHVNGRTEILNKSQLSQTMHSAITAGMYQFVPVWRTLNATIRNSANAIIANIQAHPEVLNPNVSYDTVAMADVTYRDTTGMFNTEDSNESKDNNELFVMFEPYLKQMTKDIRRQADKNEQTIVNVGSRTIRQEVDEQRRTDGFSFVD